MKQNQPRRIVIVGSGAREHVLSRQLEREIDPEWDDTDDKQDVICIPGNPGMEECATCIPADIGKQDELVALIVEQKPTLVVVGPEKPLVDGLADRLIALGIPVFGPSKAAAQIEGSKAFAKRLMSRTLVPTAHYAVADSFHAARSYILDWPSNQLVIKADGLCAGKGVVVCDSKEEALATATGMLVDGVHGKAGQRIVIEERLTGIELSAMAFTDGKNVTLLRLAQDYKRRFDGDRGPMTGGMGSYSPSFLEMRFGDDLCRDIEKRILLPVISGLAKMNTPFRGLLYAGLMATDYGPAVLEFNCRFGDPETQVVVPGLAGLYEWLLGCANGAMPDDDHPEMDSEPMVNIVLCAKSYPEKGSKGVLITGVEEAAKLPDVSIYHAGTSRNGQGDLVTNGGRVLSVAARGATVAQARSRAYEAVSLIKCDDLDYRTDIAAGL